LGTLLTTVQLCKTSFAIINSTTLLLPRWKETLRSMGLKERIMPRDVNTRWNSTYDMLDFTLEHKAALNSMTCDAMNKLRAYELNEEEWGYVGKLREVLKVSSC
jgi:hypothetical protein